MAKDPAFLFYSQDFYTGTATLSFEDKGKYIHLLCLMHQQGRMSEETIRFLIGSFSDNLKSKFLRDENGLFFSQRLETEIEKRNRFTESRRNNGVLGGRPSKKSKPKQNLKDNHMGNHMEDENEIVNESRDEKTREKKVQVIMPFDTPTFAETWQIWKKYRQEIRKPYKGEVSEQAALKKLSGYDEATAIKMLHQSMENGWTGIFELKTQTHGKQTSTQSDEWAEYKRDLAERVKQYSGGADGRHTPG